jgi:hypothetical protein
MYARLIRHVHISRTSALLRALYSPVAAVGDGFVDHVASSSGGSDGVGGAGGYAEDRWAA